MYYFYFIAPLKTVKLKDKEDQTPWVDLKLAVDKIKRDKYYFLWKKYKILDEKSTEARKFYAEFLEKRLLKFSQVNHYC